MDPSCPMTWNVSLGTATKADGCPPKESSTLMIIVTIPFGYSIRSSFLAMSTSERNHYRCSIFSKHNLSSEWRLSCAM